MIPTCMPPARMAVLMELVAELGAEAIELAATHLEVAAEEVVNWMTFAEAFGFRAWPGQCGAVKGATDFNDGEAWL